MKKIVAWFSELDHNDISIAGGKGANLGEMSKIKIPIPDGFVVTSKAYYEFASHYQLAPHIKKILSACDVNDPHQLANSAQKIQDIIKKNPLPDYIANEIMLSYKQLSKNYGLKDVPVAVRSSATAEDLPDASFAGQQETFLNVIGESNVVKRVQDCWASLFTPRAIFYREKQKYDHMKVGIAVPIQKLVNSLVSGIMFTANPVTNDKTKIIVEAIWGLGEYIVQGKITPEQYIIDKSSWTISSRESVEQDIQLIRGKHETVEVPVPKNLKKAQKLTPKEAIAIAKMGQNLHNHYCKPQDIEFAIDQDRKVYIVQARPITTLTNTKNTENSNIIAPILVKGQPASPGIGTGKVVILKSPKEIERAQKGDILVTEMTSPDYVPAMRRVAAIVTNSGGQTSHAAIVSRELGVPCIVGAKGATKVLHEGQIVTVDATKGNVHPAQVGMDTSRNDEDNKKVRTKTATKLYVNLGEPELAESMSKRDVDGIGLLRAEFMMANIGVHPKHIIAEGKQKQYINTLAKELLKFASAFSPRPIIYRATDFKTNEYKHLKWGNRYEPEEPNPLLGFRGAARYIVNKEVFEMELEAIKQVRNKHGYKNIHIMIPFVRSPEELKKTKQIVTDAGLVRSPSFKLYMMCELPTNVIQLEEFIKVGIDGVSIGSNDLTMLILGTDRDNSEVANTYNEMDPAVLWCLERTVKTCVKHGITCSICGQAPSNHPELAQMLVNWGVTAISVSPDAITRTREIIVDAEKKRTNAKR